MKDDGSPYIGSLIRVGSLMLCFANAVIFRGDAIDTSVVILIISWIVSVIIQSKEMDAEDRKREEKRRREEELFEQIYGFPTVSAERRRKEQEASEKKAGSK